MRTEVLRSYKTLHTWTGIVSGLALFIAFYAGALTMFKDPISRWASAPEVSSKTILLSQANPLIAQTLEHYPQAKRDMRLYLSETELGKGELRFQQPDPDADEHNHLAYHHYVVTRNEAGQAQVQEAYPTQLAEFIDTLHRVVGLPFDTDANRWFMGVVALIYSVALVSGLIIFLPNLVKSFFALRLDRKPRRKWLDAHNVVGITSLPFHLVIVFTSVVFAYHDGIYGVQNEVIHEGKLREAFQAGRPTPATGQSTDPNQMLSPSELVARAQALSPKFKPESLQYVGVNSPRAVVRVWGYDETAVSPRAMGGFAPMNPYTGEVLAMEYFPGRQAAASTTLSSFFALHFGAYGGTPVQWIYFLLGLAGAWLFYSGNLLWLENRRKVQRKQEPVPTQRRDVVWLAAITVGVCLGAMSGISAMMVAGKWLQGQVADLTTWYQWVYYAVFFASIAWAFGRGAAKASVDLLRLAAVSTFAIPLTTLVAWLWPSLGIWADIHTDTLSVDAVALLGAVCFWWMARITAKRVYGGEPDSVWSVKQKAESKNYQAWSKL
jgi:uncharacterized iron-regulated membrane protein